MPVCGTCGTDNPEGARFCMSCASPLAPASPREVRKTVTVVFTDLVGSTALGERLDPEVMSRITARYFERMKAVIERHGGEVEKFIGDAVVGAFGLPTAHEDDALRAVRAAAEMRDELAALNEELDAGFGVRLAARTGMNTGEVMAWSMGATGAQVTGDTMNVAARLEQAAGPGEIVIGERTHGLVRDGVEVEPLDPLSLKGKTDAVAAFRLLRVTTEPGDRTPRLHSPMVGRQDDAAILRSAFRKATEERRARMVTVLGEAGVGKSRLVAEFVGEIADQALVLRGRCLSYGEGITYWPVAEVVREAAGLTETDTDDEALAKIGSLLTGETDGPVVASRVGAVLGVARSAVVAEEIPWAVRKLVEALARRGPLVVVFDDIQWGEQAFLDLLEQLAGPGADVPLVVICMARLELLDVRPGWGQGTTSSVVALAPLADLECELLLESLLGPASSRMPLERVVRAAEGNPLYLEQMATMLLERPEAAEDAGSLSDELRELTAPPTIQALLAARLDRLDLGERETLERAAVIGEVFYWDAVAALSPEEVRSELGRILMSLVRKELIRPERSDVAGQDAFRFHHLLIRDEAYRSLPRATRADLHERFAAWLEGAAGMRTGEFEEIVGYHLEQAHEHLSALGPPDERTTRVAERAGAHLASAGHRALVRGDLTSARNLLERSHRLFPDPPPRVLVDLGLAQSDGGEFAVAQDTFDEAVAAARRNGDREMEWTAIVEGEDLRLNQATTGGATERALKMARRAMEVFDEVGDDAGLARAWLVVGNAHNHVGEQVGMYEAAQRAIEHARRAGDERHEVWARTLMSSAMTWGPLPVNEGLEVAEDLLARSSGSPLLAASALRVTGNLKALQGAFDEARSLAARIIAIYEEFGRPVAVATNLAFLNAQIEWIAQNWAEAERLLRRSSEMLEEMGEHGWLSTIVAQWANALVELGRDDEAYRCTERSEELSAPDDQASQVMWRSARAKVLAKRGEGDAAMALAREGVRIADSTEAPVWQADAYVALADVARSNGDRAEEERALREALRRYGAKGATGPLEPVRRRLGSVPST